MPTKLHVFDTTALNYFTHVGRCDLLKDRFAGRAYVTPEVIAELECGRRDYPQLQEVVEADWLTQQKLDEVADLALMAELFNRFGSLEQLEHKGEIATIVLARKLGGVAVIDEIMARNAAADLIVPVIGIVGLLADQVRNEILGIPAAWSIHQEMCSLNPGPYFSPLRDIEQFIELCGERKS